MFSEGIERDQLHKIGHVLIQNSSLFFPYFFYLVRQYQKFIKKQFTIKKCLKFLKIIFRGFIFTNELS